MTERLATTPFGGGRMRADIFALQQRTAHRQAAIASGRTGDNPGLSDKWELVRALTDARNHYGLSDRALTVLDALLSFHPERMLDGSRPIIVFPSNQELSLRSRGMSEATLRRHIAALVEAGLVLRRDSPNGKRYCRRDPNGEPGQTFGFDLAPLALSAAEIREQAEIVRAETKAVRMLRAEITLHLRDISKTIAAALEEQRSGDWETFLQALQNLSGRLSRATDSTALVARRDALIRLRASVENAYLHALDVHEMSGCDRENERHIQNTNKHMNLDRKADEPGFSACEPQDSATVVENDHPLGQTLEKITLTRLLSACPTLTDYSRDGISNWKEARITAELVRSMLAISLSAWQEAIETLGETAAIAIIAVILERAETIRSPGGYLRELTRRGREGRFSIHPMVKALRIAA